MTFLFDIGFPGGSIGAGVAIGFLFLSGAVAYVAYRLLRKTVKLALRLAIVAVILTIGFVGTMAFFYMGSGSAGRSVPAPSRRR